MSVGVSVHLFYELSRASVRLLCWFNYRRKRVQKMSNVKKIKVDCSEVSQHSKGIPTISTKYHESRQIPLPVVRQVVENQNLGQRGSLRKEVRFIMFTRTNST